jgi:Flp pilus assembly protein TadD
MGRSREALVECDKAVEYDPLSPEPLYHRASAKLRAGLRVSALADARRVLQMDPSDVRFKKLLEQASQVATF